jgi:hypothetical protein
MSSRFAGGLAAVAIAAVVISCGGNDVTAPKEPGTLSFAYSGLLTGTFDASGTLNDPFGEDDPDDEGGAAYDFTSDNPGELSTYHIMAKDPTVNDFHDEFTIDLANVNEPGTFTMCPEVLPATGCVLAGSFYPQNSDEFLGFHAFTVATVTVTSLTSRRIQGTFTATAKTSVTDPIFITNGTFDVPIRKE